MPRVHETYEALLADPDVDAVYLPLTNDRHRPWTLRALAAGKHVLCEKPLAMNAAEAEEMAAAATAARKVLMEAFMYRFQPQLRALAAAMAGRPLRHVHAAFGFTIRDLDNYRLRPELGGGALYDVGCYCVDVTRWLLGEPAEVRAFMRGDAVDMTTSALLRFPSGATASLWASFESPEHQVLEIVTDDEVVRMKQPFGAPGSNDPYRLMVEEFSAAAAGGGPAPQPVESSIANLRVLDAIRVAGASANRT